MQKTINHLIEVENLSKQFRQGFFSTKKTILDSISFSVEKGSIFGFLGANGAGKTSTIKIILGIQNPTSGQIKLFDQDGFTNLAASKIGYLPERPAFHQNLRVNEFLNFKRKLFHSADIKTIKSNEELLDIVSLRAHKNKLLRNLSKGMLQRLAIAQCLINDPELLILDEPMSGLDPVGRRDIRELLLQLSEAGKTIFFSTHIVPDVETICSHIAFLKEGQLKYCSKLTELMATKKQKQKEIIFRNFAKKEKLNNILKQAKKQKDLWSLIVSDSNLQTAIEHIYAQKAEIISIQAPKSYLEEILFAGEET